MGGAPPPVFSDDLAGFIGRVVETDPGISNFLTNFVAGNLPLRLAPTLQWATTGGSMQAQFGVVLNPAVPGTAPVFVSQAAAGGQSATPQVATPAGSVGDLMLAMISSFEQGSITPPSGWTRADQLSDNVGAGFVELWFKYATASEPADVTFTLGGNAFYQLNVVRYSGVAGNASTPTPFAALKGLMYGTTAASANVKVGSPGINGTFQSNGSNIFLWFGQVAGGNTVSGSPSISGGSGIATVRSQASNNASFVVEAGF